ncbi:MAG TPA: hypothetical protein VN722_06710 [Hanamia sp.]|nr:hypothetical protein [Hanamia sp.]
MKNNSFIRILFIVPLSIFCTLTFGQGPADPGNDPMVSGNNQNIQVPVKKTGDKNQNIQVNFLENLSHPNEHKTLIPKIYFTDYLKCNRAKANISFSKDAENERKLKFILPFVPFALHKI